MFWGTAAEDCGELSAARLGSLDDLPALAADPQGETVDGPLVLVCTHGRRDACCARLGRPLVDALAPLLPEDAVWQVSHLGGHRFAGNVLVVPWGVQLGRVEADDAQRVADAVASGRIPLPSYRGRTLYEPAVQAAEVALRVELGLDAVGAVAFAGRDGSAVRFDTPAGPASVEVAERDGPAVPASCGADPEPTRRFGTRVV